MHNFSAGPGALPEQILRQLSLDILDGRGCGSPVPLLGMSHRSKPFLNIAKRMHDAARTLFGVPDDWGIAFLQGGGTGVFSALPKAFGNGLYIHSGYWSWKAIQENERIAGTPPEVFGGKIADAIAASPQTDYIFAVSNETANGVALPLNLKSNGAPFVWDMSSDLGLRPIPESLWDDSTLIFAHAQKNWGPAGATIVLFKRGIPSRGTLPSILDWEENEKHLSILNTPPTFCFRALQLAFELAISQGGMPFLHAENIKKHDILMQEISNPYWGLPNDPLLSTVNVVLRPDEKERAAFLDSAERHGFFGMNGHRNVGGIRISLYWGVETQSVVELTAFMKRWRERREKK